MNDIHGSKLRELITRVEAIAPQLADFWQATAVIESLGYTDHIIRDEFGFPDALALGRFVYENHHPQRIHHGFDQKSEQASVIWQEVKVFLTEFSRSFIYALPLFVVITLGFIPADNYALWLPSDLAALLTLTTISSMITSGGFVQIINRRGQFYHQLGEPVYARCICMKFFKVGLFSTFLVGMAGTWFGFYRGLFPDEYLLVANVYYLILSALWMLLAILSVFFVWGTIVTLTGLACLFLLLRLGAGYGPMESQLIAMAMTLVVISFVILRDLRKTCISDSHSDQSNITLPSLSAQIYLLSPYFCYGIFYFSFIFLDRVIAGSALKPELGLLFAIDSEYQRSLDLALLIFLLLVPLVEYFSFILIRYWFSAQKKVPGQKIGEVSSHLQALYRKSLLFLVGFFGLLIFLTVIFVAPASWGSSSVLHIIVGSIGYLLFSIGLLNSIVLFSLNLPFEVIKCILPGLGANLCVGYFLANLVGADYAVYGLLMGSTVFVVLSWRNVGRIIKAPDYAYYLGGY